MSHDLLACITRWLLVKVSKIKLVNMDKTSHCGTLKVLKSFILKSPVMYQIALPKFITWFTFPLIVQAEWVPYSIKITRDILCYPNIPGHVARESARCIRLPESIIWDW